MTFMYTLIVYSYIIDRSFFRLTLFDYRQTFKMDSKSSATGSNLQGSEKTKLPSPLLFIVVGLIIIIGIASVHLFLSGLVCFVIGFDFKTVLYVSTAAIVSGTVITMALAVLMSLYCVLSFFARFNAPSSGSIAAELSNLKDLSPDVGEDKATGDSLDKKVA
ncbi:hypothetical protein Ocin01_14416 [Orchesella cincta]|uniref:Uncharacterized protein n=1 Tax=Orchesella cincta TaxID=48709 RepID=A0A1D2MGY7_ORCCI|nr:hypothetical protein Ocin01_14416 [Orchesella cincta]